jgi:adhesin/invasin
MMNKNFRLRAWTALFVSLWLFIVVPFFGGVSAARHSSETTQNSTSFFQSNNSQSASASPQTPADATGTFLAGAAQNAGSMLSQNTSLTDQAKDQARSMASGAASAEIERWLSGVGNARVRIGVDNNFTLKNSEFDLLVPWYQSPEWVVFSQQSIHRTDDRTQMNLGAGVRYFGPEWMTGVNAFYDYDLSRYHSRAGVGAELWRDYLKLGANGYFRLSGWRDAPELNNDYEARPANGWDIRAEGWLPVYPQLGTKVTLEQYYGREVGLFGSGNRQENPHAITAGLNWTPVPLVTLSAERSMGTHDMSESRFGLQLTWTPGLSMSQHLDPDAVRERRTLAGSRLDLVERNNNIVLEYRKKELLTLKLFPRTEGGGGETHPLVASLKTKYPLKNITWTAAEFLQAGGKFTGTGTGTRVTMPAYRYAADPVQTEKLNTYLITGVAEDTQGNLSSLAEGAVVVTEAGIHISDLSVTSGALANGTDTGTVTVTVKDSGDNPISGQTVDFTLPSGVTPAGASRQQNLSVATDREGHATLTLTSVTAGVFIISASLGKGPAVSGAIEFISPGNLDSLVVVNNGAVASGSATNSVKATVLDNNRAPVAGQVVTFSADNGATIAASGTTGTDGAVTMTLTSLTAGNSSVTASLNGITKSVTVSFVAGSADESRSSLTANPVSIVADGQTTSLVTLVLKDANNNPVTGETVAFSTSLGTVSNATETTPGTYTATLTSATAAGTATVTATAGGNALSGLSATVDFVAGSVDESKSSLTANPVSIVADGASTSALTLTLKDANNNPVTGETVAFSTSLGTVSNATETAPGTYTATLTSATTAGTATVTATAGGVSLSALPAAVDFVAGPPVFPPSSMVASPTTVKADGNTYSQITVILKDANGNPVSKYPVTINGDLIGSMVQQISESFNTPGTYLGSTSSFATGVSRICVYLNGNITSYCQSVTFI